MSVSSWQWREPSVCHQVLALSDGIDKVLSPMTRGDGRISQVLSLVARGDGRWQWQQPSAVISDMSVSSWQWHEPSVVTKCWHSVMAATKRCHQWHEVPSNEKLRLAPD